MFQPHQYSRTRHLLRGFAKSFHDANKVIFADIYAARDNDYEKATMNSSRLFEETRNAGVDVQYIPQLRDIVNALSLNVNQTMLS